MVVQSSKFYSSHFRPSMPANNCIYATPFSLYCVYIFLVHRFLGGFRYQSKDFVDRIQRTFDIFVWDRVKMGVDIGSFSAFMTQQCLHLPQVGALQMQMCRKWMPKPCITQGYELLIELFPRIRNCKFLLIGRCSCKLHLVRDSDYRLASRSIQ